MDDFRTTLFIGGLVWGLTTRMNPLMSRAEDLLSSSRVRALPSREKVIYETLTSGGRDQRSLQIILVTQTRCHTQRPYLTESCMVLQMCIMALRMTGSLVGSTWCLQETNNPP